ncbi:MAG: rhodanese-like domain-containing protein, partial [Solobacterium sp.]|nr:rhodanese-like domain-containing protein [Solobacterium sp.]
MKRLALLLLCAVFFTAGCTASDEGSMKKTYSYTQISQDEAKEMMQKDDGHIIVDVRREDEYAEGHIPGAVNIPNERIGTSMPSQLPDTDQVILVYCRSGNRSKDASEKLARIGYTNVYEFGGINTWTGEVVAEDNYTEAIRPVP